MLLARSLARCWHVAGPYIHRWEFDSWKENDEGPRKTMANFLAWTNPKGTNSLAPELTPCELPILPGWHPSSPPALVWKEQICLSKGWSGWSTKLRIISLVETTIFQLCFTNIDICQGKISHCPSFKHILTHGAISMVEIMWPKGIQKEYDSLDRLR